MAAARNKSLVVSTDQTMAPLSALKPKQENVAITVRVIRSWEVYLPRRGDKPVAVEMVLVDKEGTKIHAHMDQAYIYKFESLLREGSVVKLSNFAVLLANGEYRPTAHQCKLNMRFHSVVQPVPATEVDLPPYTFTPPDYCFDKEFNKNYLVDVVGIYAGHGDETVFSSNGRESTRLQINLQHQGFPFSVTLFGEYTSEMKAFIDSGSAPGSVIAVLFCKVGKWPGGTSIQTTQRTSRILFNPDIPEALTLRESSNAITTTRLTIARRHHSQSVEESFLSMDQKYTLEDIRELMEVYDFVTTATITEIVEGIDWWYWACREDHKKCSEEPDAPGLFFCKGCNKHVEKVVRKLFLKLRLHNDTECITVTLFDNIVRMLTGRAAEAVYQTWKQDPGKGIYPTELSRLIGREAIWRIEAVKQEDDSFARSYKVQRVSLSDDVIKKYKDKWASEATVEGTKQELLLLEDTPSIGNVATPRSAPVGVTQDLIEKFEGSVTGSTTVVNSVATVDLTKDTEETPPSKRKVEIDATSSSKVPIKNIKVEK